MSHAARWTSGLFTLVAILSVVPQWLRYAGSVESGDCEGMVDERRVDALLKASTATIEGGPFATVPRGGRYSVAPEIFNDLGAATLVGLRELRPPCPAAHALHRLDRQPLADQAWDPGVAQFLADTVAMCLVLQTIVIDTRYIYAHPLELVSPVVLAMAVSVALFNARPRAPENGRG